MALTQITGLTQEDKIVLRVPQLSALGSVQNNPSGTNSVGTSTSVVVKAPNGSTAPPTGYAYNVYDLEFDSPIDADGSTPDVTIRFQIGEKAINTLVLQGGHTHNMFPAPSALVGDERRVKFSDPMRWAMDQWSRGNTVANAPFRLTGLKVPTDQALYATVSSQAGWGQSGTPIKPLTITLFTEVLRNEDLSQFQSLLASVGSRFSVNRPPFGALSGNYVVGKTVDTGTIDALMGGTNQTGPIQINRKITYAQNATPILTTGQFGYSNLNAVGGASGNVANILGSDQDLGDNYTSSSSSKAFVWQQFGVRFANSLIGNGAYPAVWIAMYVNNHFWPDMYDKGILITALDNPFHYGARYPYVGGGLYVPLRSSDRLLSLIDYHNAVVPVASAEGLTQLPANALTVVKAGIQIDGIH